MSNMMIKEIKKLLPIVSGRMTSLKNDGTIKENWDKIIDIESWEWAQGIGIYGMLMCGRYFSDENSLSWVKNWVERNIKKGLPDKNINTVAPMIAVSFMAELEPNGKYMDLCKEWADWIVSSMPRTECGAFQHYTSNGINNTQLWDDTLFMTVLFLAKYAVLTNNEKYLAECEHQFLMHLKYLQDKKTGLWFHGWTFEGNHNFAKALWCRGNSWITAFIPEFLEITNGKCKITDELTNALISHAAALKKHQAEDGMWHTLIDHSDSYTEASGSAMIAYGLLKGLRLGILPKEFEKTALNGAMGVIKNIAPDGTVNKVSYGTACKNELDYYKNIPICPMAYGQANTLLMLCELYKYLI